MSHAHTFRAPREPVVPPGGVEVFARDMTVSVAADVSLAALQEKLSAVDQWLPIDGNPASAIGHLVETNSTGPLRLGYAAWRDLLLGAQFYNGRGDLISAGGRVVKNVAGYDLTKLMVGNAGVFGRLATLTTRTYLLPDGALVLRQPPDVRILNRLMTSPMKPQWAILKPDALLLGYLGDRRTLEYYRSTYLSAGFTTDAGDVLIHDWSLQDDVAYRMSLWELEGAIRFRAALPPARLMEFFSLFPDAGCVADAAFGIVRGRLLNRDGIAKVQEAARSLGGSAFAVTDSPAGPIRMDVSTNPVERQIIERLKLAFDPDGTLAPLPWQTR